MSPFRSHLTDLLLILAAACTGGWLAAGHTGILLAALLILCFGFCYHLHHLQLLRRWLANPKLQNAPNGHGLWQDVFDTLIKQAKSRKKRKQQLSAALQRFYRAAEAMPNGVVVLDKQGRIEWHNRLAVEHFNLTPADKNSILANLLRHPEFHRFLSRNENGDSLKLPMPATDNRPYRTLLLTRTAFEQDARLIISSDISEAEQLHASRTVLVANISHELRTPLTVINGFLETLADMPELPREQQQEFIALMRQEGSRMQALLNDLLTLSRLENRPAEQKIGQNTNLSALAEKAANAAQALSQGRHRFHTDISPQLHIHANAQDLYSALSNIAFNAVHYTPEGGTITIRLEILADGGSARFSVSDTGPGIAAEHLPHLTERFYRTDPARARHSGGTGLGLAITKHALAEHDAELSINSTPGVGSTFSTVFTLTDAPPGIRQAT